MTNGYTKLFGSLVTSSVWSEDDKTRIVWITLLALSNREGLVEAAVPGLARAANVSLEDCRAAVTKLESPDAESRSREFEGRRIERVDGGYRILNHAKYSAMMSLESRREYKRLKAQEYRDAARDMDKGKTIREIIKEKSQSEEAVERASR